MRCAGGTVSNASPRRRWPLQEHGLSSRLLLFNSYLFTLAFLPATLAIFFALRHQGHRLAFLVLASYVFYGWAAWWFPALMVGATTISFVGALLIERRTERRGWLLAMAVAGLLLLLGYFKYAEFTAHYGSRFLSLITASGLPSIEDFARGIVLPIGISFFTFEAISYVVDVYRGTIRAERNPLRYALFISFFPHLIAGPIVRYEKLQPQLRKFYRFDVDLFRAGLTLFSLGLAKKVLLADSIARHIDIPFQQPAQLNAATAWSAMVGYSFQIYFDFSGYTDMALGLAQMFGIQLPWNFNRPYRASSPTDFWRRWHVTLSTWLRDYLYIPLGGNRRGELRRDANLLATMGLGGLWHGASLNFVLWGLYHGVLLSGTHHARSFGLRLWRPLAIATTFILVTLGWVLFRFPDHNAAVDVFSALFGLNGIGHPMMRLLPLLVLSGGLMWGLPEEWSWDLRAWGVPRLALVGVIAGAAFIEMNETTQFLYFRF